MTDTRFDILGTGVATIDELLTVDHFPRVNEKQRLLACTRQCGGLTGAALVTAARLQCRCGYIVTLGDNELSSFMRSSFAREGISLLERQDLPEAEPYHSRIIIEKESGERSVISDNSKALPPRIGTAELELVGEVGCLFVDHVYAAQTLEIARTARRAGTPVVGDFERMSDGAMELMDLTDHLILPLSFARKLLAETITAEAAARHFAAVAGRSLACITDGSSGAWYALGEAPARVLHQSAFHVDRVVDSTGCGDVFHGAYAAGLVKGWPPAERIRRASAAAALKTRQLGAQAGAPTMDELESFLQLV